MRRGNATDIYIFLFSGVFVVVSVMALMGMNTSYGLEEAYEGIGFRQSALLATYEEVDKYQEHTNQVAKYSIQEALLKYTNETYAKNCELVGSYPSWSDCFVDVYTNPLLFTTIKESFSDWWSYDIDSAQYRFSIDDEFVGESQQKIFFPILGVKGDSVKEVASVMNKESSTLSTTFSPDSVLVDTVLPDNGFSREVRIQNIVINSTRSETVEQEKQRLFNTEESTHYLVSNTIVQMLPEEQSSCSGCDFIRIILIKEQNDRLYELLKDLLDRHNLTVDDILVDIEGFDVAEMKSEVPTKDISSKVATKSKLVWPLEVQNLESCFGERQLSGETDHHDGIDIAVPEGQNVGSVADGEVIKVCEEWVGECACAAGGSSEEAQECLERCDGKCGNFGNYVVIQHSESLTSRYSHLQSVDVSEGESVRAGETIAQSGNTGYSFGAHLDLKLYSPANNWNQAEGGSNPLCFYENDVIRNIQLTDTAHSCRDTQGNDDLGLEKCDVSFTVESNRCFSEELQVSLTKENNEKVNVARSRLQELMPNIEAAAREYDIPRAFLLGIITQESLGDPDAVSPTGAAGIMQFVADTARSPEGGSLRAVECGDKPYACTRQNDDRFNPAKAIPAGAKYLRWILDRPYIDGDLRLAAQAYNSGVGTLENAVEACEGSADIYSCVREFIIENNEEYGAERFDPDYSADVMAHMAAWGGAVSSSTCESLNVKGLGSVEYRPDFAVEVPPVMQEFEELVSWAEELNEVDDNLHDLDMSTDSKWEDVKKGFCEENPANLAVMQLQECQNNGQTNCSCLFDLPVGNYTFKDGLVTDSQGNKINSPNIEMNISVEENKFGEREYSVAFPDSESDTVAFNGSFVPSDESMCLETMQRQAFCAIHSDLTITQEQLPVTARFGLVFNDSNEPVQANGASLVPLGSELVKPQNLQFSFSKPVSEDLSGVIIYCQGPEQDEFTFDRRITVEYLNEIHSIPVSGCAGEEFDFEPGETYSVAVHSFDFGANENVERTKCMNLASFTVPEDESWQDALGTAFTGGWYEAYQTADDLRDLASGCSLLGN